MVQQVKAYGQILQFPDGMSEADMAEAIRSNEPDLNPDYKQPSPEALDYAKGFASGANKLVSGVGYLAEAAGANETGKAIREFGDRGAAYWNEQMSPGGKKAAESQVFVDDPESITGLRLGDDAGKALLMGAAQSLPSMFAAALPGVAITKGIQALASLGLAGGAGATIPLLAGTAAPVGVASQVIARAPAAVAFGSAEGLLAGGMNAAGLKTSIEGMSDKELLKSPVYQALRAQHGEEKARSMLADQAASDLFGKTAVSTGAIGALTGGGALGSAYQKVTSGAADGILMTGLKGAGQEAIQETPQSGAEKYIENITRKEYLDPSIDPMSGVIAEAASGGAIGAFTGGIVGTGSAINITKQKITPIADAPTVDDAIVAAHEAIRTEGPTLADVEALNPNQKETADETQKTTDITGQPQAAEVLDIEALTGVKPSEGAQEQGNILIGGIINEEMPESSVSGRQGRGQSTAIGGAEEYAVGEGNKPAGVGSKNRKVDSGVRQAAEVLDIVLPDNTSVKAQWKIVDADSIKASMKEGVNQPRDRTRAASDVQIKSIANAPDYRRLSDSPVMDVGAPVVDQNGRIVAGNGRFAGLSQAYDQGTATDYINQLREDAARKGLSIEGIAKPVLVRQLSDPVDTRKMAIASNSGTTLQMSALEQANLDAERMKGIENLDVNDLGDIALTPRNLTQLKDSLGSYTSTELGSLVDKGGQLSQEGMRRVRNAMLAKAYGSSPTLEKLVESTDSDMRNVLGALTKSASHIIGTKGDTKALLEAVDTYSQLKATGQPVDNFLAQQDAFSDGLSKEAESILRFIDTNVRSQKKLTAFFKGNFVETDTTSADMFSTPQKPLQSVKAESRSETTIKVGKVGDKMSAGEVVLTASGRKATPFPKLDFDSKGKTTNTIKRVDTWLIDNAIKEAESRGDAFNILQFRNVNLKNLSQSDKDAAEEYLFGQQPDVPRPFTKPMGSTKDERIAKLEKHLKDNGYDFRVEPTSVRDIDALDSTKKARKELAEKQAKFFKKKIVFVKSNGDFSGVVIHSIADTIFIDINTTIAFDVLTAHELSHWMEEEKPAVYREMIKSLKTVIKEDAAGKYAKYRNIEGATNAELIKEIAGDLMGDNFTEQSFWNKVAEANPGAFKDIAAAIIKWLKGVIVKAKANGMGSEQWVKDATKAQDIIAKAVAQYTESEAAPVSAEGKPKFHKAFHGSPHDHSKFDSSKIGTGEGAQAYGYGHYLSSSADVAQYYRDNLSGNTGGEPLLVGVMPTSSNERISDVTRSNLKNLAQELISDTGITKLFSDHDVVTQDRMLSNMINLIQDRKVLNSVIRLVPIDVMNMLSGKKLSRDMLLHNPSMLINLLSANSNDSIAGRVEAVNVLAPLVAISATEVNTGLSILPHVWSTKSLAAISANSHKTLHEITSKIPYPSSFVNKQGKLYEVELAPEQDEYLLWDKPLSEQSDKVKSALGELDPDTYLESGDDYDSNETGQIVYHRLTNSKGYAEKKASDKLHSLGIRGIKYLDGSSRAKGEGAYNYVIFDDKDVSITAKFSKAAVENTLIAQHNLTAKNLIHVDRMGGLAAPSIAITDKKHPLHGFGEITLLSSKDLVDPKQGAKAYGSDIYSPRYPELSYDFSGKAIKNLNAILADGVEKTGDREFYNDSLENDPFRELTHSSAAMYQFLKESGKEPELAYTKVKELPVASLKPFADGKLDSFDMAKDDGFRKLVKDYWAEKFDGEILGNDELSNLARAYSHDVIAYRDSKKNIGKVDRQATNSLLFKQITDSGLRNKFDEYLVDVVNRAGPKERIFQGYTPSGNRRYIAHDIDNVIKMLKKDLRGGENFKYGLGSIRAKYSPQFKSIEQIKKSKDRLMDSESFDLVKKEIQSELNELDSSLSPYGTFSGHDNVETMLSDTAKMGVSKALTENGFKNVPDDIKLDIGKFLVKLKDMPTEYFEVKLLRSVGLGEFSAAIIPDDSTQQVRDILKRNGIDDIREYKAGDNQDRVAKISTVDRVMFSRAPKLYSKLEQALEAANDKVFSTGPQVKLWLQSNAGKLGIKKDEIYWSGIDNWLEAQGKVSKQQVVEFVRSNGVQVEDVMSNSESVLPKHNYSQLNLPGGTDYKELVVTVPTIDPYNADDSPHFGGAGQGKQIGWIRMDTRGGGLFIEELQSQRSQGGRKMGFGTVPPAPFISTASNKPTASYITLLMKKALIEAVSNDHSSVSWTTGDQQIDRYDLKTGGEWAQSMYGNEQGLDLQGKPSLISQAANDIFKHVGSGKVESINGQPGFYVTPEMKSKDLPLFSKADTVVVDGVERPTTNSEGKPINNPVNFWKWFGADANVDDQGRPKVLYHSTLEDVSEFNPVGKFMGHSGTSGISLTDNKEMASRYLDRYAEYGFVNGAPNQPFSKNVMPVYVKIGKFIERNEPFQTNLRLGAPLPKSYIPSHVRLGYDTVIRDDSINRKGKGVKHSDAKNALRGKEYIVSNPNQIKSAIGNNGDYSLANNDILFSKAPSKPTPPDETRLRRFQRMNQDSFNRFTVIKEWLAENGQTLSDKADVHGAEERYHSMAANQLEDFREQQRNPLIEKIQKAGYTLGDIEVFLKMQHTPEANAANQKLTGTPESTAAGITDEEANEYLAEAPENLAKLANELRDITEQTKKLRLDAGILNTDITGAWENTYKFYVPMKGEADSTRGVGKGLKTNFKSKRRLGHSLRDEHVIENILMDHERAILEVERNRVGKHLVMMAAEMQRPDILSIDQPEKRKMLKESTAYTVEANGVVQGVFKSREEAKMFKQFYAASMPKVAPSAIVINQTKDQRVIASASPMLAENEVNVYMNGHAIRVQINDELLARAYTKMGVEQFSDIVAAGRVLNGYLSKVYTGYNPEFILTNMIRDFSSGTINLTGEQGFGMAIKAISNYPRMFGDLLKYAATNGKSSTKWIDSYRANGGNTGAAYLSDMERLGNEVSTEYASHQGVMSNLKQGDNANAARAAGRKVFNATLNWIYNLNQAGENAMRLAAFKAMLDSGRTVNEAAKVAKNITVNFNRKGERQWAPALYLFYNASVQGTAATGHALFKGKHKGQAWALAGSMAAVGYMMAASFGGGDEDDWDEISDYTKERNMLIKSGDGYVKVPVPYGYGFFWNLGRYMSEAQRTGEWGKMPWHLATSAMSELTPFNDVVVGSDEEFRSDQVFMGLLPTAMKIVAQPTFNKQLFTGSELMPDSPFDKSQPDREKMFRSTKGTMYDTVAGWLDSAGIDISPETLKYTTRTFTGGAGSLVDTGISAAMLKAEGAELDTQEIPFVRKAYMELGIKDKRAAYYKVREEARTAAEEFNRARRANDTAKMQTVLKDKNEMIALDRFANKLAATIDAARDQQDAVRADKNLSVQEKRLKLKDMEATEAKFYDQYLDVFKASSHHK